MKTNYLTLLFLSCIIISCNTDELPPIKLESLRGTYMGETRIVHFNGKEYLTHEEIISIGFPADFGMSEKGDGTMIMELFPIWPESATLNPFLNTMKIAMKTIATSSDVILTGNYSDSPFYSLTAEAKWTEENLIVDLDYKSTDERLLGNTFIIRMNENALDFSRLYPSSNTVEFDGEQIPIEDFVKEAMSPIFRALSKNLGAEIKLVMKEDGSMDISAKKEGSNSFTNIPGEHRHWLHSENHGYFEADYEGASWLHKILQENEYTNIALSGTFETATREYTQNFAPILYYFDDGDLVYSNQNWDGWLFEKYLATLLNSYRLSENGLYEMTLEERGKISTLINLLKDDIIRGDIFIRAKKQ